VEYPSRLGEELKGKVEVISRRVTHDMRYMRPFPIYCVRAQGSHKWDVDGHEYIDYFNGHGALMLGHSQSRYIWHSSQYLPWQMLK